MTEKRVVITGMGAVTSIGKNINEFKDSLFAGRCGISLLEGMDKFGELTVKVDVEAHAFSKSAIEAIESQKGKVVTL